MSKPEVNNLQPSINISQIIFFSLLIKLFFKLKSPLKDLSKLFSFEFHIVSGLIIKNGESEKY